jgi:hypothetical protein
VIRPATGRSVALKPVPRMIVSTSRSVPSEETIDLARTWSMPSVTRSTLGCWIAGYHVLENSRRLHAIT